MELKADFRVVEMDRVFAVPSRDLGEDAHAAFADIYGLEPQAMLVIVEHDR